MKKSKSTSRPKPALNAKQQRFIAEYLVDLNATHAAIRAGYSKKTAKEQAHALLRHPLVQEAVQKGKKAQVVKLGIDGDRTLEEARRIALLDPRGFFKADGNLKSIQDLTEEQAAALASFEVIKKNAEAGDGKIDTVYKIRFWSKPDMIELLCKHLKLLNDTVDVNVTVVTAERAREVQAARKRLEKVLPTKKP